MMGLDTPHSSYRRAVIIYNPFAGRLARRERRLERSVKILAEQGTNATLIPTTGPNTASRIAKRVVNEGADLIVVAGGDGTINEVVNGVAHSNVPVAILPGGTANVLAHELGVNRGIEQAAAGLSQLQPCRITLGLLSCGDFKRYFLSMAGIGLDAHIVYNLNLDLKAAVGKLAYYAAGMLQVFRPLPQFEVDVMGRRRSCGFVLVSRVRNYGGDLEIARGASLLSNDFEVVLFEGKSSVSYLRYLAGVAFRFLHRVPGCTFLRASTLCCEAAQDTAVYSQIDGELACRPPLMLEAVPDALTLLVPAAFLAREQAMRQVVACA
jgi:diacylglycerol kinase (ATP)